MNRVKKRIHHIGFNHAWDGIVHAFVYHHNLKIHSVITILVVVLGFYFGISVTDWLFLVLAISFGLFAEMVNTAIGIKL